MIYLGAAPIGTNTNITTISMIWNCGRLTYTSATQLAFKPFNGDRIMINGILYAILSTGISGLGNTGVFVNGVAGQTPTASTTYLVYAFINNGIVTADFRVIGSNPHSTSTTTGNVGTEILTGNDSRSLIGMVFIGSDGKFYNQADTRCVISWFNRRNIASIINSAMATSSTTSVNVTTGLSMLNWGDEGVPISISGIYYIDTPPQYNFLHIGQDGVVVTPQMIGTSASGNQWYAVAAIAAMLSPTEGLHTFTGMGGVSAGTGNFNLNVTGMTRG